MKKQILGDTLNVKRVKWWFGVIFTFMSIQVFHSEHI